MLQVWPTGNPALQPDLVHSPNTSCVLVDLTKAIRKLPMGDAWQWGPRAILRDARERLRFEMGNVLENC